MTAYGAARRLTRRMGEADLALLQRWGRTTSPVADQVLPRMTRAADHSVLWLAIGAAMASTGSSRGRRAAARGVASVAVTSAVVNGPVKVVFRRARPPVDAIPLARRLGRRPESGSFPSGHSASAAAFATAVGAEWPALAGPLAVAAAGVAWSRVHTGVHYPSDCAVGLLIGATTAALVRRAWPTTPPAPAHVFSTAPAPATSDGAGVTLVVNPASGTRSPADELRARLPAAEVAELKEGDDCEQVVLSAAGDARVLAVAGGDGTVSVAAKAASDRGIPLLVLPCGTLNHFARQLGLETVDSALAALAAGCAARVDLGDADGMPFVNTASIGGYSQIVRRRERLEGRIGKWPALLVALLSTVLADRPIDVELDGQRHRVWLVFVGNGRHEPPGLAPTWRPRLDEGLLDVRIVTADRRFARARVLLAAVTRRLERCSAYDAWTAERLEVRVLGEPQALARDGEVGDPVRAVTIGKRDGGLVTYRALDTATGTATDAASDTTPVTA